MKRLFGALVIIIILALSVTVEREASDTKPCSMPQPLTYAVYEYPEDLRLVSIKKNDDKDLLGALFSGLVKKDADGKVVPSLCESFSVSDDGIEYRFTLRDDIYYSSGGRITAKDYKDFLCSFLSDRENAYACDLDSVYGVPAFRKGETGFDSVAVNAEDDKNLIIRLNEPDDRLLDILSNPVFSLRDYNELTEYKDCYKSIRYTGPFIISDIDGGGIYLSKNEKYFDSADTTDELIKITCCSDKAEALARLEESIGNDAIDILKDIPSNEVSRLRDDERVKIYDYPDHYYILFSDALGSEDFSAFRDSIEGCIDRKRYAEELSSGYIEEEYAKKDDETADVFSENKPSDDDSKDCMESLKQLRIIYKADSLSRYICGRLSEEIRKKFNVNVDELQCSGTDFENRKESGEYDILIDDYKGIYGYNGEFSEEVIDDNVSAVPVIVQNSTVALREGIDGVSVTDFGVINLEKAQRLNGK